MNSGDVGRNEEIKNWIVAEKIWSYELLPVYSSVSHFLHMGCCLKNLELRPLLFYLFECIHSFSDNVAVQILKCRVTAYATLNMLNFFDLFHISSKFDTMEIHLWLTWLTQVTCRTPCGTRKPIVLLNQITRPKVQTDSKPEDVQITATQDFRSLSFFLSFLLFFLFFYLFFQL